MICYGLVACAASFALAWSPNGSVRDDRVEVRLSAERPEICQGEPLLLRVTVSPHGAAKVHLSQPVACDHGTLQIETRGPSDASFVLTRPLGFGLKQLISPVRVYTRANPIFSYEHLFRNGRVPVLCSVGAWLVRVRVVTDSETFFSNEIKINVSQATPVLAATLTIISDALEMALNNRYVMPSQSRPRLAVLQGLKREIANTYSAEIVERVLAYSESQLVQAPSGRFHAADLRVRVKSRAGQDFVHLLTLAEARRLVAEHDWGAAADQLRTIPDFNFDKWWLDSMVSSKGR